MNRKALRNLIRSKYPNNPQFKKAVTKLRIKRYSSYIPKLSETTIRNAEEYDLIKTKIVMTELAKIRKKEKSRFGRFEKRIDKTLELLPIGGNKDQREVLRTDIWFCWFAYGFLPEEYFCYELIGKPYQKRKGYISEIDKSRFVFQMNDIVDIQILNDKARTYQILGKYYQRDAICINDKKDYNKFEQFVKQHPIFVKKNVFESVGKSVSLVDLTDADDRKIKKEFQKIIQNGKHILEEKIIQSEYTATFHKNSVNTLRCITFNTRHGIIDKYYFMKIGQGGAFIDNGGAGGILVGADRDTGRLNTDGFDEFNRRYTKHPDTGIVFNGYQLPDWNELRKLCCELSSLLPTVKYIGWDLAHTANGWVVVEGNGMSQMIGPQTIWKYGCKEEVEGYMRDMDLTVKHTEVKI